MGAPVAFDGLPAFDEAQWQVELISRRERLREIVHRAGCAAVVVFASPEHRQMFRYLTDFVPVIGDAWLIVSEQRQWAVTQFSWQIDESRAASGFEEWEAAYEPEDLVLDHVREALNGGSRIGVIGMQRLPHRMHVELSARAELVDLGPALERERRVKTPLEVALLQRACAVTDRMLDRARELAAEPVTELDIAAELSSVALRDAEGLSFESVVISGFEQASAIRRPTSRRLREGDTVLLDIGAQYRGYQADAGRSFVIGEPTAEQERYWAMVLEVAEELTALAVPGTPAHRFHDIYAERLRKEGFDLRHRIGHGIGLATSFEWPSFEAGAQDELVAGMTIAIEPGVYRAGMGNLKLEENLLVTEGAPLLLSHAPRHLAVG
ncbi:Xaa-Pro peptidase family protein [Microbacterium soli]|uniref:Xaa-Pro dipeptidase PepQ n=1 Tax=Microbacterium soli TaxID=446075 RepID=A0ABP7NCY5_9MICO